MPLNNCWVTGNIKGEIKVYLESNENENTAYPNFWDQVKSSRGNFIAMLMPTGNKKFKQSNFISTITRKRATKA